MKKSSKKSAKKSSKKNPIVKLQMKTEKVTSASGKEYYRPVKKGKKSKPVYKTVVKKPITKSELQKTSIEKLDVREYERAYKSIEKEVKDLELQLELKYKELMMMNDHIKSLRTIMGF